MSPPPATSPHYEVIFSKRVLAELRVLAFGAAAKGLGQQVLAAVREIQRRLEIYPQFGDPIQDLSTEDMIWVAVVPPLLVRNSIDENVAGFMW